MSIFHITIQVDVDDATITPGYRHHIQEALEALADVMAVQAEDGLYVAGSPEVETFENDGDTIYNEKVADVHARVGSVTEVEADDAFDFASSGSRNGFIETGRFSTVREEREINAPGGFDPDQSYCLLDDTGDYWAYNHPHGVWVPVMILGGHFPIDNHKSGLFFTERATAGFPSDQIDATGRARGEDD